MKEKIREAIRTMCTCLVKYFITHATDVNFADPSGMWNAYHMQPEGELHYSRVRVLSGDSVFRSLSYSFDHTNNTFHYLVTELKIYHTFLFSRKRAGCLVILNPVEAYSTL